MFFIFIYFGKPRAEWVCCMLFPLKLQNLFELIIAKERKFTQNDFWCLSTMKEIQHYIETHMIKYKLDLWHVKQKQLISTKTVPCKCNVGSTNVVFFSTYQVLWKIFLNTHNVDIYPSLWFQIRYINVLLLCIRFCTLPMETQ